MVADNRNLKWTYSPKKLVTVLQRYKLLIIEENWRSGRDSNPRPPA